LWIVLFMIVNLKIVYCYYDKNNLFCDTKLDKCHEYYSVVLSLIQTSMTPLLTSHNVMVRPQPSHYWPVTMSWSDLNTAIIDQLQCHGQTSTQPLLTSHNVMVRPQHSHYWPVTMSWSDLNTAIINHSYVMIRPQHNYYWPVKFHAQNKNRPLLTSNQ
jgi:hypothetical protein